MKPGDKVWLGPWNVIDDGEAILLEGPLMADRVGDLMLCPPESELLPDHPALPAVARWLVEHNDALVYGQHTPGDWIDVIGAYADETDDVMDRMLLTVSVIPALRALIAALTEATR